MNYLAMMHDRSQLATVLDGCSLERVRYATPRRCRHARMGLCWPS
jgi:hypothetical protein